jgi:Protein of unknown function (DUF3102)
MKKPNKSTALDRLATELRIALRRETKNILEIGKILVEIRDEHLQHGEWQRWLAEHFDLSYHTARNYVGAAEYVERNGKSGTVQHFENLAPSVLYGLVAGRYNAEEEAAILAAARQGRVDQTRAGEICDALKPEEPEKPYKTFEEIKAAVAAKAAAAAAAEEAEDAEVEAILDGPPPVPPPEPSALPDVMLSAFDRAITALMQVMTKPAAQFAGTIHTANDLEHVEAFLSALRRRLLQRRADTTPSASSRATRML